VYEVLKNAVRRFACVAAWLLQFVQKLQFEESDLCISKYKLVECGYTECCTVISVKPFHHTRKYIQFGEKEVCKLQEPEINVLCVFRTVLK
jgi:hypothetical protein